MPIKCTDVPNLKIGSQVGLSSKIGEEKTEEFGRKGTRNRKEKKRKEKKRKGEANGGKGEGKWTRNRKERRAIYIYII